MKFRIVICISIISIFCKLSFCSKVKNNNVNPLKPPRPLIQLGAPKDPISGEHISRNYFTTLEQAEASKAQLQDLLHNFLDNLQKNLTTSSILSIAIYPSNTDSSESIEHEVKCLNNLWAFFEVTAKRASNFSMNCKSFLDAGKNESGSLVFKLRRIPSAQHFLPREVKIHLTDYFNEMEFLHITLMEVVDDALDYITTTLHRLQRTFAEYSEIQRDVLTNWNLNTTKFCYHSYMDFLRQYSAQIYKCASEKRLNIAYDVYAMTEMTLNYVLRELEFRILRIYNCFLFGNYELRCRFIQNAEVDFEKMFGKLDELQMYIDVKTKRGRMTPKRNRRNTLSQAHCIPFGFPYTQMVSNLKTCFNLPMN